MVGRIIMHNNALNHVEHVYPAHSVLQCPALRSPGVIFEQPGSPAGYLKLSPFFITAGDHSGIYSMPFHLKPAGSPTAQQGLQQVTVAYPASGLTSDGVVGSYPGSPSYQIPSPFSSAEHAVTGSYPIFANTLRPGGPRALQMPGQRPTGVPLWNTGHPSPTSYLYNMSSHLSPPKFLPDMSERALQQCLRDPNPEMPVFHETRDPRAGARDDSTGNSGIKSSAHRKGRQRSLGPLSSHAVYARLNRERRKKYLADLENYRNTMRKRQVGARDVLQKIHEETDRLTEEIALLRGDLQKNSTLMDLLTRARNLADGQSGAAGTRVDGTA